MYAALATAWNLHRRVLGLSLARARRVLRRRRLRQRDRVPASRPRLGLRAVPAAPGDRRRRRAAGDPDRLAGLPHPRSDVRDRHAHARLRRPAAGLQPAFPDRRARRASRCHCRRSPSRTSSCRSTWRCSRVFAVAMLVTLVGARLEPRPAAVRDPRRRGPRARPRRAHDGGQGRHIRDERRPRRHGRRRLGLLHRLHLSPVRDRPADHDRDGADGVPGRQGHALGPCAGRLHPGAGAAVPGLPARRERALPRRLLRRLPGRDAAAAARHPPLACRQARTRRGARTAAPEAGKAVPAP